MTVTCFDRSSDMCSLPTSKIRHMIMSLLMKANPSIVLWASKAGSTSRFLLHWHGIHRARLTFRSEHLVLLWHCSRMDLSGITFRGRWNAGFFCFPDTLTCRILSRPTSLGVISPSYHPLCGLTRLSLSTPGQKTCPFFQPSSKV